MNLHHAQGPRANGRWFEAAIELVCELVTIRRALILWECCMARCAAGFEFSFCEEIEVFFKHAFWV